MKRNKMVFIRGFKVPDGDLGFLAQPAKKLASDFVFQLSHTEYKHLISQIEALNQSDTGRMPRM